MSLLTGKTGLLANCRPFSYVVRKGRHNCLDLEAAAEKMFLAEIVSKRKIGYKLTKDSLTQLGWSVLIAVTKMRFSQVFAPFANFYR